MSETRFKPGHPGGPGRPKGSKHRLAEAFVAHMSADFEANGPEVIKRVREDDPATYLRVVASVLPKDINLAVEKTVRQVDDDTLADIALRGGDGATKPSSGAEEHNQVH